MKELKFFKSTNGTMQIIAAVLSIAALAFGFPEKEVLALIIAVESAFLAVREWLKTDKNFSWSWNIPTYLVAILLLAVPSLSLFWETLPPLFDAIKNGNISLALSAAIMAFNTLMAIIRGKEKPKERIGR